jgi:ABC-type lipoprotein release transport system permease subunit
MMNALNMLMLSMKLKFQQFCTKENGDVNIVSIVVLIGIAVLLAIVFKHAISGLINDLLETITSNATDAVNTSAN